MIKNPKITHIEKVEIKGLWGKYDVDWTLNRDVNILIGENGTGKSTILQIIRAMFSQASDLANPKYLVDLYHVKSVKLWMNNDLFLDVKSDFSLEGMANIFESKIVQEQVSKYSKENTGKELGQLGDVLKNFTKNIKRGGQQLNRAIIDSNIENTDNPNYAECVNIDILNTFDTPIKYKPFDDDYLKDKAQTELDVLLYFHNQQLRNYLLNLKEKEDKETEKYDKDLEVLMEEENVKSSDLKTIIKKKKKAETDVNKSKNTFFAIVNEMFALTGKTIALNESNSIIFKQDGKELSPYKLSSGEKQLLIILLKMLLQDEQPSIILMDEPEISLHIRWQHQLIDVLQKLNPNCQLIIVTHSPSMFGKGWGDKITFIGDIIETRTTVKA